MYKRKEQTLMVIGGIFCITTVFIIHTSSAAVDIGDQEIATPQVVFESIEVSAPAIMPEAETKVITETVYIPDAPDAPDVSGIEETFISDDAYNACLKYGEEYGVSPELLMAVIERESRGDSQAYNGTDSGIMQIAEKWHYDRMEKLGVSDLFDTDQNIHIGADFLAELFEQYGDAEFVLMCYNMGYETAYEYYSQGIISEYAQEIIARADELTLLHTYGGTER